MFLTSQIPRIFNDNFNSRNSVKGEIVALCLNVRDLRHLLKIEHENLEFIFPGCSDSKGKFYFYFISRSNVNYKCGPETLQGFFPRSKNSVCLSNIFPSWFSAHT